MYAIDFILADKGNNILFYYHIFDAILRQELINKLMKEHNNETKFHISRLHIIKFVIRRNSI